MADSRLVLVAERHNPKRAFLLVSTVLGKHLPVSAARCRLAGLALGLAVAGDHRAGEARRALLGGDELWVRQLVLDIEASPAGMADPSPVLASSAAARAGAIGSSAAAARSGDDDPLPSGESFDDELEPYLVVGFAETATALGEQVASALDAVLWQTTTRQASIAAGGLPFAEPHSHAPEQWIARPDGGWPDGTLVLVDDELTTGRTACNLIEVLHEQQPRERYVIAALLDGRGSAGAGDENPIEALAARLGVTIDVVALGTRPAERRTEAGWSGGALPVRRSGLPTARVRDITIGYSGALQHDGQDRDARLALAGATVCAASELGELPHGTLMLGTGEHLAFAQRTAVFAGALTSSSTRSPVLVSDQPDYPIRDGLAFPNPDDLDVPGFAYNVLAAERPAIVVHFQDGAHRERGQAFLDLLAADGARDLIAVTLAP